LDQVEHAGITRSITVISELGVRHAMALEVLALVPQRRRIGILGAFRRAAALAALLASERDGRLEEGQAAQGGRAVATTAGSILGAEDTPSLRSQRPGIVRSRRGKLRHSLGGARRLNTKTPQRLGVLRVAGREHTDRPLAKVHPDDIGRSSARPVAGRRNKQRVGGLDTRDLSVGPTRRYHAVRHDDPLFPVSSRARPLVAEARRTTT